ncbi:MAG: VOC family protein [Chloroflexi bacterium]|nr:VOC family protein [Chloroflexota bacterium]
MIKRITHGGIYVRDVDEAMRWYTDKLGFVVRQDAPMGDNARWVTVGPKEQPDFELILQQTHWGPDNTTPEERAALVGKTSGFVMETDNIRALVDDLKRKGVEFTLEITDYPWGTQAAFKDLYGHIHVLSQPPG